uniref:Uncharacterized protein n=1 Tax=Anguilla anguilla TaxID=7936 RepID=A0A0E9XYS0_ANGAN
MTLSRVPLEASSFSAEADYMNCAHLISVLTLYLCSDPLCYSSYSRGSGGSFWLLCGC